MSWENVLSQDDYRLYKNNISLLEERVIQNFPACYRSPAILSAIRRVPRHLFVNPSYKLLAYTDNALPTRGSLTTSAPSVIARMIFEAEVSKGHRVLEIGTGTGYQAAVLAEMGVRVWTIEIERPLAEAASRILIELGYKVDKRSRLGPRRYREINRDFPPRAPVEQYWGNGYNGLAERSPFDAIILAASAARLEQVRHLSEQLSERGGRLVAPLGDRLDQVLHIVERKGNRLSCRRLQDVTFQFVRMVGRENALQERWGS